MAQIPKVLKNFSLTVRGRGYAGIVDEVTLPTLSIKEEEHRAGGMDAPHAIDMGMEKMELKFTLAEHDRALYRGFGIMSGNAVDLVFRGAKVGDNGVVEAMIVVAQGSYKELGASQVKAGDKNTIEATVTLNYYSLTIDGEPMVEIDVKNMKRVIGGFDVLAEMRAAIDV